MLIVTSHLPDLPAHGQAARILALHRSCVFDVVATVGDLAGFRRVQRYLSAIPAPATPDQRAPWRFLPDEQLMLDGPLTWAPGNA